MIISEISKQKFRFFLDKNIIFQILQIILKEVVARLWEYLKNQFADLKTTVMDAIMVYRSNAGYTSGNQMDYGINDSGRSVYKSRNGDYRCREILHPTSSTNHGIGKSLYRK